MNIMITGVGGLVGGNLCRWILQNVPEAMIIGVDDYSCGYPENHCPDSKRCWTYRYSLGGESSSGFIDNLFNRYHPDYVFHLAAYAAEGLSPFIRRYNYVNNLLASVEIINACIKYGCRRLVFTASMAVYGNQQTPFNETMYPMPIDPYGVAKAAVERDIQIAGDQHGLSWTIIRPHNVYGPGQDLWTPYRNVLGIWMARTFQNLPMRIYGDGEQVRAFSYIDDCLPCLWRAATLPTTNREIINLGGTKPVSINVAASTLLEIMERGDRVYEQARHEVKEAWCTWEKSAKLLGYQDHTPLEVGLERMWDWAQEAWRNFPERRHQANFNYEIKSGIYPYWENLK